MIRYLIHRPTTDGKVYAVIAGLSTDAKPTADLITGSRFVAADTGARYMFDESAGQWNETDSQDQIDAAVQAWLEDHPEAIDQAAIEAMFGDQLDGIEEDVGGLKSAISDTKNIMDTNLFDVGSTLNPYSGYDGTGKRINSDGIIVSDANYNTYRYTFTGLSILKIVSDDKFIFQSASTRPTSAPNQYLVGTVHETYNGVIEIPTGATNLYISTPSTGGTASVASVINVIDKLTDEIGKSTGYGITWESGFINSLGNEASNSAYKRTNYIPIGAISDPIYYKVKATSSVGYIALYDEGHNLIECVVGGSSSVTETTGMVIPNAKNAKYVRISSNISGGYEPTVLFISNSQSRLTDGGISLGNLGSDIITLADGCNPINYDGLYEGKYINATGGIGSSTGVWATDYIAVDDETTYYQENVHNTYYAFYDSTKTFISGYSTLGDLPSSFTPPEGAAFARFTLTTSAINYKNAWINTKNEMPSEYKLALSKNIKVYAESGTDVSNPCDYSGEEITTFVKGICIGDSLTAGAFNTTSPSIGNQVYDKNSYPRSLERITGIEITNAGHSGYTSAEWYAAYSSEDFSGHDFAIIQLGVNDQIRYHEFGDTSKTAFENIFTMLKTQNPKIKIFVANIIPALSYQAQGYLDFSDDLLAWVTTKHGTDADIIPLDIQQFGHTKDSEAYNCGHLSAFGYNQLARDYKAYISWYMAQNKMEFRQVQFIGTEWSYSD